MLEVKCSPVFNQQTKRLHKNQIKELSKVINKLANAPSVGISKKGDLSGIFVYKFNMNNQLTLVAYCYDENELYLLSIGSHQNFYRDLKK